jgi:internalin A
VTSIPDANLRAAIEEACGKSFGQITDVDLSSVTQVYWANRPEGEKIADLTGIELCPWLRTLFVPDNAIADLAALASITSLGWVIVDQNLIDNLTPLLPLRGLVGVHLMHNPLALSDLSSITPEHFPHLIDIGLSGYDNTGAPLDIGHTDAIALLEPYDHLRQIHLSDFPEMGSAGFAELYGTVIAESADSLAQLYVGNCGIGNAGLASIANLTGLEELGVWANGITDITPLATLILLNDLGLNGNQIVDLAPLRALHEAGGLAVREGRDPPYVDVTWNGLDLSGETANREVIDYLLENGVTVDWELQGGE